MVIVPLIKLVCLFLACSVNEKASPASGYIEDHHRQDRGPIGSADNPIELDDLPELGSRRRPIVVLDDEDLPAGTANDPVVLRGSSEDSDIEDHILHPRNCNENCSTTVTSTTTTTEAPRGAQALSLCDVDPNDHPAMREYLGWGPYSLHHGVQPRYDIQVAQFNRRIHRVREHQCCNAVDANRQYCPLRYLQGFTDVELRHPQTEDLLPRPDLEPAHRPPHFEFLVAPQRKEEK